jgi:hypothetical protein
MNLHSWAKVFIFCVLLVGFATCDTTVSEPDGTVLGYDYFPTDLGSFVEYEVEEVEYDPVNPPATSNYQIREDITESFTDIEGKDAFRVERYRRDNGLQAWDLDSVWVVQRTANQGIRIENNQVFVKMAFPVSTGLKWNGNTYNHLDEDEYEITALDKSFSINEQNFAKSLKVIQADDSSLVSLDRRQEVYARGVGLVYRFQRQVVYCTEPACLGLGKIEFGIQKIIKIKSYGF